MQHRRRQRALVLRKELKSRCEQQVGIKPEWAELLRCLYGLQLGIITNLGVKCSQD